MLILQKIWLYGGWFYLSLFSAIVLSFIFLKKAKYVILNFSLFCGLLICLNFFFQNLKNLPDYWKDFKLPVNQKINKTSFGQDQLAKDLKEVLPADAKGCIYWSWDIPTRFLSQKLYPHIFIPIEKRDSIEKCAFLISQFEPVDVSGYKLTFSSQEGYLYKKND